MKVIVDIPEDVIGATKNGSANIYDLCGYLMNGKTLEPCEDAISRQAVMDALCNDCELFRNGEQTCFTKCEEYHFLATLPSVTPQSKTGRWIKIKPYPLQMHDYECSECGHETDDNTENYCSDCGAKMVETQESER